MSSIKCKENDPGRNSKCSYKWKYKSCESKRRYRTENEAKVAARNCMRHRPGANLHCYFCPICHGWHLTRISDNLRGEKVF